MKIISAHAMAIGNISHESAVTECSRLVEDLLIVGDDADELFWEINHKIGTDFSDLCLSDYFPSEVSADMHCIEFKNKKYRHKIFRIIDTPMYCFWRLFQSNKQYKEITVFDVCEAVEVGRWIVKEAS